MIKVYLDWNVMTALKEEKFHELRNILNKKDQFITPFSTAHIGDIYSSYDGSEKQNENIKADLEFISMLTDDRCLFSQVDKIIIDDYSPKELFDQRIDSGELFKNVSEKGFTSLFDGLGLSKESLDLIKDTINIIPLPKAITDLKNINETEILFPGLKENPTYEGLLNGLIKMMDGLNKDESYKILRETVQTGLAINRDKLFDTKKPFDKIKKVHEKAGIEFPDILNNSKYAPSWYNNICSKYLELDMHGYQEDKVIIKKGKRQTFKNTTEDAFHCAFASTCNFYITNDDRTYKKSKQVYERLELQTLVLKPEEFVKYYTDFLDVPDDNLIFSLINEVIGKFNYYEEDITEGKLRVFVLPFFLFDFFNKIIVILKNDIQIESIILSRNNPTHNFLLPIEITNLLTRLNGQFGIDIDNSIELTEDDLKDDGWKTRKWIYKNIELKLIRLEGHFQLYFNFIK